jgi:hypothetical protein
MLQYRLETMELQTQNSGPKIRIDNFTDRIEVLPKRILQDYATLRIDGAIVINILLVFLGLVYMISTSIKWWKNKSPEPSTPALVAIALTSTIPVLMTPLDWDRYYLFPVFFSTIIIVLGIRVGLSNILTVFKQRS